MAKVIQLDNKPWLRANNSRRFLIFLSSVVPLPLVMLGAYSINLDMTMSFLTIFLPLQILTAALVGFQAFGKRGIGDAILVVLTVFFSLFVLILLLSVLGSVLTEGFKTISSQFIIQNNVYVSTTTSLDYGGVGHAILGSLMVVALTTLAAVPLGIAMAIYLTQSQSKIRDLVRTLTQALSGLPSVVSGLFILTIIEATQIGRSGFTGALALFPLMLPTVARVSEEALKLVPVDLRYAALALGAPNYRAFFQVILPAAKSGLITALLLGLARVVGETAPLILTVNANNGTNFNVFEGGLATLPTYIYGYLASGYQTSQARAWGAALILLILVGILFGLARVLGRTKSLKSKAKK
ncbi:MAG: phosphate ABC transporter permease PstA [Actinobacteria bacterium]|nr:phosphate ABC transporter permease PstA [Actinomycetota bacterium]